MPHSLGCLCPPTSPVSNLYPHFKADVWQLSFLTEVEKGFMDWSHVHILLTHIRGQRVNNKWHMIVTVHLSWRAVCRVIEGKIPQPDMLSGVMVSTLKRAHQLAVSLLFCFPS